MACKSNENSEGIKPSYSVEESDKVRGHACGTVFNSGVPLDIDPSDVVDCTQDSHLMVSLDNTSMAISVCACHVKDGQEYLKGYLGIGSRLL